MASLINLTRNLEIGANCYYLDLDGTGVVLDAGMHPKIDGLGATPNFDLLRHLPVEAVFITHAHHDHVGALPLLRHLEVPVFMSEPTYFLTDILLHNSVNVMKRQKEELGIAEYPLYRHEEIKLSSERWHACHLGQRWTMRGYPSKQSETTSFEFHHAGHILGAVAIEIQHKGQRILYSGDINFADQTVLRRARLPERGIDVLIIEGTRGAHPTPPGFSREAELQRLIESINETFERDGVVMIPVFAMGKTQETLTALYMAQQSGELDDVPIFIGGLSFAFNQIYDRFHEPSLRLHPRISLGEMIAPKILDGRKARNLKLKRGHIYLISSGMMNKNTLSNILAQEILAREQDSIFFVGYTDPASPAGRLRATARGQRVMLNEEFGDQPVLCEVSSFDLTAHALREDTLNYIRKLSPRKCILVHGDLQALEWFKSQLAESHPSMEIVLPQPGERIEL